MSRYMQIEVKDYEQLISCINYVINKFEDDRVLVEYLSEQLAEVEEHTNNEQHGDSIASEITEVISFIQDGDGDEE